MRLSNGLDVCVLTLEPDQIEHSLWSTEAFQLELSSRLRFHDVLDRRVGDLRRQEAPQPAHPLDLLDLFVHARIQRAVPSGEFLGLRANRVALPLQLRDVVIDPVAADELTFEEDRATRR